MEHLHNPQEEVAEQKITQLFEVEELEQRLECLAGTWHVFGGGGDQE